MEQTKKQSGFGIASLVLGIIGMILSCVCVGIIFDIIAIVLGIIAIADNPSRKGLAISGIITSVIGVIVFILFVAIMGSTDDSKNQDIPVIVETETNVDNDLEENTETEINAVTETEKPEDENAEVETETHIDETEVKGTEIASETEKQVSETMEEYKASCQEYNYKDVLRNPENYIGQRVKITAKVYSVHDKSWLNPVKYYFAYTNDEYDMWIGDEYGIFDYRDDGEFKILEDDIIAIYGEISEPQETTSLIVNSEELFCIDMKYAELISE